MCGLIGIINTRGGEVQQDFILDQYDEQKGRGSQGFGLIRAEENVPIKLRRSTEPMKAMVEVTRAWEPILLFHHRFPTSTPNSHDQTHPMLITHNELAFDYLIMHNGVIRNPDELRKIHENDLGYIYRTRTTGSLYYTARAAGLERFNDSEAFAIELARFIEKKEENIRTFGSAAFLAMAINKETKAAVEIFWGTNGMNPLIRDITPGGIIIASSLSAGEDIVPEVLESIKMVDLFSKKETDLNKYINLGELNFQKEPEKSPIQIAITGTPPTTETKETAYTKNDFLAQEKEYLPKEAPAGYTEMEWALHKIGLRAMKKVKDVITQFTEDLALGDHVQIALPNGGWVDKEGDTLEDKIDYAIFHMEEVLTEIGNRAEAVKAYYDEKEKKELIESGKWTEAHPMDDAPDAASTEDSEDAYAGQTEIDYDIPDKGYLGY